jgi:hypothetical protein
VTGAWHFGQPMSRLEAAASISSGVWQVGHLKYSNMAFPLACQPIPKCFLFWLSAGSGRRTCFYPIRRFSNLKSSRKNHIHHKNAKKHVFPVFFGEK